MIKVIIEVDGYLNQVLLTGRKCSKKELKQKYLQAKALTTHIKDLANVFSRLHNFEQIPYDSEIQIDFVIDTDTDRIYSPSY
ncbi:hypothetical protein [Sutcliffiella rhizosphaerae]|uniref:Uncharacterized protein n=1 Tax=Sutcliffiella rhizosphaerae TaxID=2880967 RepID=A0ABN8AD10_9BACI|nr:hypothetical protein [Sutcliffiella rhizosphaerae]CAG9623128.1 hypothetical protein BACCIP111883_03924 [Sutcliffiella rhizosphaerae]